jgi:hypothetical protein
MKITTAQLKQIIKEEIQALTEEDEEKEGEDMAYNYLVNDFGKQTNAVMELVYAAAEDLGPERPSEEELIELFKGMGYTLVAGAPNGKDDDEPMSEGPSVDAGMAKIEKEKTEIRNKLADKDLDLSKEEKDKLRARLKRLTGYMN